MKRFALLVICLCLASAVEARGCRACKGLEGFVRPDAVSDVIYQMVGKIDGGGSGAGKSSGNSDVFGAAVEIQKQRGAVPTGTRPKFLNNGNCPRIDSETWAKDYTKKRGKPALHKGIDIPQPKGTPVLAAAAGTVVGKFRNSDNPKGIEVVLRHRPDQTGLPFYTYTQYTHLLDMSPLPIGASVKAGDEIAKISNSGKMGRRVRRDALHFAVLYSYRPEWTNDGTVVAPAESFWMDPVMFFDPSGPWDSAQVKRRKNKSILTPYVTRAGQFVPQDTQRVWPFACN